MAVIVSFKLRDYQKGIPPSKQKETPIIMMVNYGYHELTSSGKKKYIPLKYATKESIKPFNWNIDKNLPKQIDPNETLTTDLENLKTFAKKILSELGKENVEFSHENFKKRLDELNPRIPNVEPIPEIKPDTLNQFIETFISEIKSGERLTSNETVYKHGTIKNYLNFKKTFAQYQKKRKVILDYEDITLDFYDDFVKYFISQKCSPNYIGRHIKNLKAIMRAARDLKLHNNMEIDRKKFKTLKVKVDNIYLTESEIKKIHELDLSKDATLDRARDVFLLGCYTAQRFSDYIRINENHIITLKDGSKAIKLNQLKTGKPVIIPIMPQLDEILKKYNYSIPKTYEQKVNEGIKKVGEMAKITELTTIEEIKGGKKVSKTVPKCLLIKTHTGRRSACTNMYNAHIRPIDIMKISGHTSERIFLTYIKIGEEENADNLSSHPYFNNHLRVAK